MYRLLYISTARRVMGPEEIAALLEVSRRNNAAADVTGLLVVGGRRFLQALEGPRGAVLTTFDRIRRDPRHHAIVRLVSEPVAARAFAGWAMGTMAGGTDSGGGVDATVAALVAPIADPSVRGYFLGFAAARAAA